MITFRILCFILARMEFSRLMGHIQTSNISLEPVVEIGDVEKVNGEDGFSDGLGWTPNRVHQVRSTLIASLSIFLSPRWNSRSAAFCLLSLRRTSDNPFGRLCLSAAC